MANKRRVFLFGDNNPESTTMTRCLMSDLKKGDWFRLEEPDGTLVSVAIATEDATEYEPDVYRVTCILKEEYNG